MLRLKGNSMVDPQTDKGDDVIARAQPWVEHRDVGGVMIPEVKTILHRSTILWLKIEDLHHE
jgi:SOS-response transcriptional repressor LexA